MKREALTKEENCLPVEKSQNLHDAIDNFKEEENPVAKGETKLHKSYNNQRTVLPVKKAVENYKEENPVAKGEKKLHKSQRNQRTFDAFKEAFEDYTEKKNTMENYEAPKSQVKETKIKSIWRKKIKSQNYVIPKLEYPRKMSLGALNLNIKKDKPVNKDLEEEKQITKEDSENKENIIETETSLEIKPAK